MTRRGTAGNRRNTKSGGFTLVELLIVIAIMAVLAAVTVPLLMRFSGRGKSEAYDTDQQQLQTVVYTYKIDYGCLPTADGGGGDGDSSYIVFSGYIGNVDANGYTQQVTAPVIAPGHAVNPGEVMIYVDDVDAANQRFMVGHSIHIAAGGGTAEDAIVLCIDAAANTLTLKQPLSSSHAVGTLVTTNEQGLTNGTAAMTTAPKSSAIVTDAGGNNINGGLGGTYRWYCDANGGVQTDPPKDKNVYP